MIPKIIHYVWVGGNPKPKNIQKCMKTWSKHLKDYQIIEWNESNFDIHENKYVEQAYKAKKWAFVSDYIRAKAIYEMGGIYLDTDVLVLDDLHELLDNRAFVGFENIDNPFTAVFGAEPKHPLIKDMLDYYDDRNFEFDASDQLKGVNTVSVSDILKKYMVLSLIILNKLSKMVFMFIQMEFYVILPVNQKQSMYLLVHGWRGKNHLSEKLLQC